MTVFRVRMLASSLILLLVLASCSFSSPEATTPVPTAAPTAAVLEVPEGGTLSVRIDQDVGALHPWAPSSHAEEQMLRLLYRSLTRLDANLVPQPDIATSWTSDSSGRTLTMTLRTDVTWHDGTPLQAADAAWTLNMLRDISPTTTLLSDLHTYIADVQAPTSSTLVLKLNEAYAPLLAELSTPILPEHIFGSRPPEQLAGTDFWREAIGSGPFKFEERQPDQAISFVRNENDPDQVPFLDRVAFIVAPDTEIAIQAFRDGEVLAGEMPWNGVGVLSNTQDLEQSFNVGTYPENSFYFLALNTRRGHVFNDVRVRQALQLAIDQRTILEVAGNQALGIRSTHLPTTWAAPSTGGLGNGELAQAEDLLNQAGWILPEGGSVRASNGITLSVALYVRGDDQRRVEVAERIASAAHNIGIDLVVTPADFDSVIQSKLAPPFDFDAALMSWSNNRVSSGYASYAAYDPDDFPLFHSSQIYQGPADGRPGLRNFVGFNDSSYDNLSVAARALYDTDRRRELYHQTDAILAEKVPYIFLWANRVPVFVNTQVQSARGPLALNTPMWLDDLPYWYLTE